jgi:hypothetical protein
VTPLAASAQPRERSAAASAPERLSCCTFSMVRSG